MQTISFFRLLHASLFISMLPALASTHVTNKLQGMAVYKTKEDAQEAWRKINTDSGLVDELEKTSSLNKDLIRIVLQMALPAFRMPTFYSGGKNGWIAQNNLRKLLNTVNLSNKDDVAWAYIDQLGFEDKTPILKLRFVGNDLKGVFCNFTDEYLLLLKKRLDLEHRPTTVALTKNARCGYIFSRYPKPYQAWDQFLWLKKMTLCDYIRANLKEGWHGDCSWINPELCFLGPEVKNFLKPSIFQKTGAFASLLCELPNIYVSLFCPLSALSVYFNIKINPMHFLRMLLGIMSSQTKVTSFLDDDTCHSQANPVIQRAKTENFAMMIFYIGLLMKSIMAVITILGLIVRRYRFRHLLVSERSLFGCSFSDFATPLGHLLWFCNIAIWLACNIDMKSDA